MNLWLIFELIIHWSFCLIKFGCFNRTFHRMEEQNKPDGMFSVSSLGWLGAAVGRSGYYWFIYHWAIMEDDPAAGGAAELWPVSVFHSQLLRALLTFLNMQARKHTRKLLWKRKVCVCDPPSSAGGKDEINGVQFDTHGGLGPDHLLRRCWSICELCSGSFWPFLSLRAWLKSDLTDSPESPELFLCGENSICQVPMRRSLLKNKPRQAERLDQGEEKVTLSCLVIFSISVLITNLTRALVFLSGVHTSEEDMKKQVNPWKASPKWHSQTIIMIIIKVYFM